MAATAERAGAQYVLPAGVEEHTGCAPVDKRWVDFFDSETDAYPMHPTPLGQEAMAEAVTEQLCEAAWDYSHYFSRKGCAIVKCPRFCSV